VKPPSIGPWLTLTHERANAVAGEVFQADHARRGGRALQVTKAAQDDPGDGASVDMSAELGHEMLGHVGDVGIGLHAFSTGSDH
jgi:hypothetical protein